MEFDPEQIETARDAALRAARQRQPPQPTHAFETLQQQSLASTLRLISHPATDPDVVIPLSDSAPDGAPELDASEQALLGGPETDTSLSMAPSALPETAFSVSPPDDSALAASAIPETFALGSDFDLPALSADAAAEPSPSAIDSEDSPLDPLAMRPGWDAPSGAAPGSASSFLPEPDDSHAFVPDNSPASELSPPTALDPPSGELTVPPSAADVDWSDPSIGSAQQSPSPVPLAEDGPLSEPTDKSLADRSEVGGQPAAGRRPDSTVNDEPTSTDGAAPSNMAAVGGDSSAEPAALTVIVTLDDREELVAQSTQEVAALAESAAQSTIGQMIDERVADLSESECMRSSQREAAAGFF